MANSGKTSQAELLGDNVFCLRTFLAISDVKGHSLAFGKGFETVTLNGTEVDKNVWT